LKGFAVISRAVLVRSALHGLHVARLRGQLDGDTPEERWRGFARRLCRPEAIEALFQEYPVLAREVVLCIDRWVAARASFAARLCADWESLRDTLFPGRDPGVLARLVGNPGDTHHGDSVVIAEFSSGLRLVYKPRSLAVDLHFQELLAWLNERGDHPPFPTYRILDRGSHGWAEFVAAGPCASIDELRRFYRRSGGYLAVMYALCATDMHAENVLAAGESPFLIDLEALFHPELVGLDPGRLDHAVTRTLEGSVLRVGLLPERRWPGPETEGIDLSGLNATAGQLSPTKVRSLDAAGTDQMRFVRRRVPIPGSKNRPSLAGAEIDILDHSEDVAAGFDSVYRTLLRCREDLLAPSGPLLAFAEDEVRVILRDTQTYARLHQESYHPDALRDALDRDRLFDQLWSRVEQQPSLSPVVPAERRDLLNGDLPRFTTRAGSRDLRVSAAERLEGFFDLSGLDLARRRIERLGERDLARQLWFVRSSFATLAMSDEDERERETIEPVRAPAGARETERPARREELLSAARAVGDRLAAMAVTGKDEATWLGITPVARRKWALAPLGNDLYDGVPGIALFLAFLGAATEEPSYTRLSRAALRTVRRSVESHGQLPSIGAFTGWGGLLHCHVQLAALWDDAELLTEAERMVGRLAPFVERDEELDVLGGAAGCIVALLGLHRQTSSERALDIAIVCGDRLIARAEPMERGIGWRPSGRPRALTGFTHGAAGMAWALLSLWARTGRERFRTAALDALEYERSRFVPAAGNWPDLRRTAAAARAEREGRHAFLTAWCHGAPGIGLARLRTLPYLDDAETRAEIEVALRTTLAGGFGKNHSLCHGDLGNLDILLEAGERLGDARWTRRALVEASAILARSAEEGFRSGTPFGVESPGLMTGLAGIGYGLLRLASPARTPSVLSLSPPPSRRFATQQNNRLASLTEGTR
jgi:type 2 lantibiotic biosynthesis protein LanM